jgi:hypothetical protein
MRIEFKKGYLAFLISLSGPVFAATSVWDNAKLSSYQMTGKINSIAINDQEILIRITSKNGNKVNAETFKLCSSYPGGDSLNMAESERMKLVRAAFQQGDSVQVSYGGPFDRCLSSVSITKEDELEKPSKISKSEKANPSHL